MTHRIDEKNLRRKILATFHQDGIAEMIFGTWFLSLGFSIILDANFGFRHFYVLSMGPLIALSALYPLLKSRITLPRIGYVKFPTKTVRKAGWWSLLLGVLVLTGLIALFRSKDQLGETAGHIFIFTFPLAMTGVAFALGGYRLSNPRWLFYSAITAVFWIVGLLVLEPGWIMHAAGFTVAGAVPVLGGLIVLIRFLRNHPIGEPAVQA